MCFVTGGLELGQDAIGMEGTDIGVSDHDHALVGQERPDPFFGIQQQALPDDDLIGLEALTGYRDVFHSAHLPPSMWA